MKRSNTIFHNISSRFSAVSSGSTSPTSKIQKVRIEAQEAEKLYRQTVKRVEVLRMTADQQTESHLQYMHKLELDRLRFMKATLKRYQAIAQTVAPQALLGKTDFELMIQAMQPEADLQALCEMYRITNGYRPEPILFQDHYGEFLDA